MRAVVSDYYEALSEHDAERACELLGPHAHDGKIDCVPYAKEQFDSTGDVDLSDLEALAESGLVTLRGKRATVSRGADNDITAIRVDGDWKIDRPRDRPLARSTPTPRPTPTAWESAEQTTAQLAEVYRAFERAHTDDDPLVLPAELAGAWKRRGYALFLDRSRLIARLSHYEAHAFPASFRHTANVCTAFSVAGETIGLDCGAHTDFADQPHTSHVTVGTGSVAVTVFPDGVSSARLETRHGSKTALRIKDGVAIVKLADAPTTLTWTDERGGGTRNIE